MSGGDCCRPTPSCVYCRDEAAAVGTMDQALVKRRRNTICTTSALSDEEAQKLGLKDSTEVLSLTQALAEG
jgi:hypothetical protein